MQRQNIRVAIVDDNTLALKQIEFLMKRIPNTETHCFSSPNYFVVMLLSRPIDIAIIDINMPELDGIRILRILANECFRSPILIHSAVNDNLLSDIKKTNFIRRIKQVHRNSIFIKES